MVIQLSVGKRGFAGIVTALAILVLPQALYGQDKAQEKKSDSSENIKFDSVDGVELRGSFYAASKAKAPAVLMLHRYGGSRQGWEKLAEELQAVAPLVDVFEPIGADSPAALLFP